MGIRSLLQFPHPLRAGPVPPILLFFPLVPSSYWVLRGPLSSFPLVRSSCLLSAGVLHALLCLKVYPWHIRGERCTPAPPPPSCSLCVKLLIYINSLNDDLLQSWEIEIAFLILQLRILRLRDVKWLSRVTQLAFLIGNMEEATALSRRSYIPPTLGLNPMQAFSPYPVFNLVWWFPAYCPSSSVNPYLKRCIGW